MRSRKCNNILGLFGLFITAVIGLLAYYNESMIGFPDGGRTEYEMALFEAQELEVYLNDFSFKVKDASKTIYEEFVPLDSGVESRFAQDCESSDQIKLYFKLPNWFKIPTPIGNYNPDWALVFEDDKKIYFVAETKDTGTPEVDLAKLSGDEQLKIKCGKAHFNEFDALEYKVVNKVGQLI